MPLPLQCDDFFVIMPLFSLSFELAAQELFQFPRDSHRNLSPVGIHRHNSTTDIPVAMSECDFWAL